MTGNPPQEDIPENPQSAGAQDCSSILKSSHGSRIGYVGPKKYVYQKRAIDSGVRLGKKKAVETFVWVSWSC